MAEDYYEVLGVARTASQDEIKKAFRKKAHEHHPDKSGGNEEMFKQVNEAYQVLGDEQKRSQYDQFGRTFAAAGGGDPFAGFGGFQGFNIDFEDVFSDFFGGSRARAGTRARRGSDIQVDVTISFSESARGVKQQLRHTLHQTCVRCHGNGAEPGTPIATCATCQGSGVVGQSRQTLFGVFTQQAVCPTCQGEGKTVRTRCKECRGEGRTRQTRTLEVTIPAGIADGQIIRLAGKGEVAPRGGVPGDLFMAVHVTPDKDLRRDGEDVRSAIIISFADAALGTTVKIQTLAGGKSLKIPAGTQPGTELRLSGLGFPSLQGTRTGDHTVTVNVEVPKKLSRQQKKLLEEFKNTKKKSGWF